MLNFTPKIKNFVLNASSKALATIGTKNLNVVPVSTVQVHNDKIWLFDYFMHKTTANIKTNSQVALACWNGLQGFQIKGQARYFENGEQFERAKDYVHTIHPDRTLKGLIILDVTEVFDISVG